MNKGKQYSILGLIGLGIVSTVGFAVGIYHKYTADEV